MSLHVPKDALRVTIGPLASDYTYGANGAFVLQSPEPGWSLFLICCDGIEAEAEGWEHVSVQACKSVTKSRIPTWREMCLVKDQCWDPEDVVMQLHPKHSEYVNRHQSVLHLWRHRTREIPLPPRICV